MGELVVGVLMLSLAARGNIVVSGSATALETDNSPGAGYATAATYTPDILSTDLIDVNSATFPIWNRSKTPLFESSTLNDGIGHPTTSARGTYWPATFGATGKLPVTYNFAETLWDDLYYGCQISEIRSYAGWNSNGSALANQQYELLVSRVGSSAFTSLGTFQFAPFSSSDTREAAATKMVLTEDTTGVIASGVDAIRFVLQDHGVTNGNTAIDGSVYFEIDVLGQALPAPDRIAVSSYVYDGSGQGAGDSSQWPDTGTQELTDSVLPASTAFTDPAWVGYRDDLPDDGTSHPQVTFDLGGQFAVEALRLAYLHSTTQAGGSITAPESVLVSASAEGTWFSTPLSWSNFDSSPGNEIREALLYLDGLSGQFFRLDFRNTSQWTFLAEVDFLGRAIPEPSSLSLCLLGLLCLGLQHRRTR
jgi:hypothetical protein